MNRNEELVIDFILDHVKEELLQATMKFGSFNSHHEGYAVIKEELDEAWDAIKTKGSTDEDIRAEMIQVAAMAVRHIFDLCNPASGEDT